MSEGTMVAVERGFYEAAAERAGVRALAEEPLARHTTMRVGGPAQWFFLPGTPESAARLWAELRRGPLPVRILGWGSNVVAVDAGVRAAVICTDELRRDPELLPGARIAAWAGVPVPGLARWAAAQGLSGLEFAEGIPAQLGGAVRMNAGANRSSFSEVTELALVAGDDGRVIERALGPADFAYRESFASREKLFVLGARLRLAPGDPAEIRARMSAFRGRRRATQPIQLPSAGCVFANYADQSVGALVERLGLKGRRRGDAEVSTLHGNFIVNRGQASAADVLGLLEEIRTALAQATGQAPRIEVEIWRDEP
ncbi:MAG: UDP-N-acetylmuramate dehydrogenase [Acidobacteria bacterium]|jgi:UDP-N-acetylmuramate dehydrogenase|nr:UDP-N-acetylmuramate dehydrogenase [Acidobacteriota bacterium]